MSTMPTNVQIPADASRLPMTLPRLIDNLPVHAAAPVERASDPETTEAIACSA